MASASSSTTRPVPTIVEIKTATNAHTQEQLTQEIENDLMIDQIQPYSELEFGPLTIEGLSDLVKPDTPTDDARSFAKAIKRIEHRCQVLHHCAAIGIDNALYVQADLDRTRRIKSLRFTAEIRELYLQFIKELLDFIGYYTFSSNIVDFPSTPESNAAAQSISGLVEQSSYCRDVYTIAQYFAMGNS